MRRERRKNFRVEWNSSARIYYGELDRPCILSNLSNGGARITGVRADTFPDEFLLRITPHGHVRKCRVLWRTDDALGVQFVDRAAGATNPIGGNDVQEPTN
jgi:PilZ domain